MLRRPHLAWARQVGPLNIYVGPAPAEYLTALAPSTADTVYTSLGRWYLKAIGDAARGNVAYFFKPGELQMSLRGLREHVVMVPLLAIIRLRGGRAIRVGAGARSFNALFRWGLMPSVMLSDISAWRDLETRDFVGRGLVMPDLAFNEGMPNKQLIESADSQRTKITISLRADNQSKGYPPVAWLNAIRNYASRNGLEIWTTAQVRTDDPLAHRLARDLRGTALPWYSSVGHKEQELRVRQLFAESDLVLSDRLHVLIAASTEGAMPVAAQMNRSKKIARHFDVLGINDIQLDCRESDDGLLIERLLALSARRRETILKVVGGRRALDGVRLQVLEAVEARRG